MSNNQLEMSEAHPKEKIIDTEKNQNGLPTTEEDDSPFAIVRATVSNKDDPNTPSITFRFWLLSVPFTILLAFLNQFFYYRTIPITIGPFVVQLLSYPLGKSLERLLPDVRVNLGLFSFSLNPAPFSIKEHALISICASAGTGVAYAVDIINIKKIFYHQDLGMFASLLLVLTTQCLGYGMAGICYRYLVRPAAMIWPANLVSVALFRTMNEEDLDAQGGTTRFKFFMCALTCSGLYYFLPGFLAPFLASISILCYIAPDNLLANQVGSFSKGLGVLSFSLDWNTITGYIMSPLVMPFWAICNIFAGAALMSWVLIPIGFFTNTWDAKNYPLLGAALFKDNGDEYDVTELLSDDLSLDENKYAELGPPRMTYMFAVAYGVGFAGLTAILSHTFLYHGKEILARFREARSKDDDIHTRLMDRYPAVPEWWYFVILAINVALSILVCEVYGIDLPWWGVLLAVGLALVFVLPIGIITAVSNQTPGLNVISEFIIGYILPGRPIANVTFKTYGYISMAQAVTFLQDLKLGHYMKIPPRHTFLAQVVGTVIAGITNVGTAYLMYSIRPDVCSKDAEGWTCENTRVFFSASVIWGLIGPNRMFGPEAYYSSLMWWFLLGLLAPVPFWLLARRYPQSWVRYIHIPVLLGATGNMPPATPAMYAMYTIIGFIFNFVIFRYRTTWWNRYNYILSSALDSGVGIASLIIFFAFTNNKISVDWWGTKPDCPLLES